MQTTFDLHRRILANREIEYIHRARFVNRNHEINGHHDVHITDTYEVTRQGKKDGKIGGLSTHNLLGPNHSDEFVQENPPDWNKTTSNIKKLCNNGSTVQARRFFCYKLPSGSTLPDNYKINRDEIEFECQHCTIYPDSTIVLANILSDDDEVTGTGIFPHLDINLWQRCGIYYLPKTKEDYKFLKGGAEPPKDDYHPDPECQLLIESCDLVFYTSDIFDEIKDCIRIRSHIKKLHALGINAFNEKDSVFLENALYELLSETNTSTSKIRNLMNKFQTNILQNKTNQTKVNIIQEKYKGIISIFII